MGDPCKNDDDDDLVPPRVRAVERAPCVKKSAFESSSVRRSFFDYFVESALSSC